MAPWSTPCEPEIIQSGEINEKRDFGEKPKSLSLLRWCRRRDLNPHALESSIPIGMNVGVVNMAVQRPPPCRLQGCWKHGLSLRAV